MKATNQIISRKDIIKVFTIILTNWYVLLGIPAAAFVISYVYTHRIPNTYAAKCQILLKSNEAYDYQQQIYRGLGLNSQLASYEYTASQMRVLKSSGLIEEVLDRLSLDVAYFIIGRLRVTEVYQNMPFKVFSDERSLARSGMEFHLDIIDELTYRLSYEIDGVSRDRVYKFGQLIVDDGLYLRVDKQRNLTTLSVATLSQINYMFKVFKERSLISNYKSSLDITNLDYTSIVEVTLQDQIPERAEAILDTLANVYVLNTLENRVNVNENTLSYIDRQLDEVIGIINEIEAELELYKEQKEILDLTKEAETYFSRLVELETKKGQYVSEINSIEDLTTYLLQNDDVKSLLPPSMFVVDSDPQLYAWVTELYKIRATYNSMKESGTSSNPAVSGMLERIEELKKDMLLYLDVQKSAIQDGVSKLDAQIAQYEEKIKGLPKTQRQLLNIERKLQVNEELYSFLLSKRAETVIAKAGLIPETKIIERARSIGVVYPDKGKMNLTNLIIGLVLAVVIVVVRVIFFHKISDLGQLQDATDTAILGSIPKKKDLPNTFRITSSTESTGIVHAFRVLRTNLQYFSPQKPCKRILVTSLMPAEGKTFTSINLASILALAEKRVLIIDLDLHKPRLAKSLQMDNAIGVSSFLIGEKSVKDIIQHTDTPHLDIISSGPAPPNASELILREELKELFEYADEHYDYVFIDTPPIALVTDGVVLMNLADVRVFVLNSRSSTRSSIEYIEKIISENDLDHCALVLNEEKQSRLGYYGSYKYGYGYGGYGYGAYGSSKSS